VADTGKYHKFGTISLAIIDKKGVEVEFVGSLVGSFMLSTAVPSLATTMKLPSSRYKFVLEDMCQVTDSINAV